MTLSAAQMAQNYFQVGATSVGIFNCLEVLVITLTTFKRYNSVYCVSLLVACMSTIMFSLAVVALFFELYGGKANVLRAVVPCTIGWWGMVTGFAMTLYSRLRLLGVPAKHRRKILFLIAFNFFFCHIPTSMFTVLERVFPNSSLWVDGYAVIEPIQMTLFALQEILLGLVYLVYLRKVSLACTITNTSSMASTVESTRDARALLWHSMSANLVVLGLDVAMLVVEYVGLYGYQNMMKGLIYSLKLKFEFFVLNQLGVFMKEADGMLKVSHVKGVQGMEQMQQEETKRMLEDSRVRTLSRVS